MAPNHDALSNAYPKHIHSHVDEVKTPPNIKDGNTQKCSVNLIKTEKLKIRNEYYRYLRRSLAR